MHIWLVQRAESTPHDAGGKRRPMRVGIIAKLLAEKGHHVTWWTSGFDHVSKTHRVQGSRAKSVFPNYDVHYLQARGYSKNISFGRFLDDRQVIQSFRKECREVAKPDVILASIPSVGLANEATKFGLETGVPVALDIRDLYPDVFEDLAPNALRPLVRFASAPMRDQLRQTCQNATCVLGITEAFVQWGVANAGRDPSTMDQVFPMAYEKTPLDNSSRQEATKFWADRLLGRNRDHLHVLFLGTFTNSFDFDPVIEAAKLLHKNERKVNFTFCGTGAKQSELREKTRNLANCDLVGWIDAPAIKTALELADVGLAPYIPSPNFIQNVPNKPAEYMSGGLIVASALENGALFKVLTATGSGFSYSNDPKILAERLIELMNLPEKKEKMKLASADTYQREFSSTQVYQKMITHLEKLVRCGKRSAAPIDTGI